MRLHEKIIPNILGKHLPTIRLNIRNVNYNADRNQVNLLYFSFLSNFILFQNISISHNNAATQKGFAFNILFNSDEPFKINICNPCKKTMIIE